jgi:dihydrofolate reductase
MSLDGFIAGPGDAMDWIFDFMAPDASWLTEIAAATGAMLIGRRTYEVAKSQRDTDELGRKECGGGWSGPVFVLTPRPPKPPDPADMFGDATCL